MSKGEYLIVPKGTKFKGSGKLGLEYWFLWWRGVVLEICPLKDGSLFCDVILGLDPPPKFQIAAIQKQKFQS